MRTSGLAVAIFGVALVAARLSARGEEHAHGANVVKPRMRVIVDNDFGGDPDGLFQLAHHLLSPSVEVRGIIGSHNYDDGFYGQPGTAEYACEVAGDLLAVMGRDGAIPVYAGANDGIGNDGKASPSEASRLIVREALRDDAKTPLYVVCGAGLTDVASAWLAEPRIGTRLTLVWIGGPEHAGQAPPPPGARGKEYNLGIDPRAAQVVFNDSDLPLWQVPRDAYRQALASRAELQRRVDCDGPLGGFLVGRLDDLRRRAGGALGEAYVLGDSPLVLLTVLQSAWEADPASSRYVTLPAPRVSDAGQYTANPAGRPIRVYTQLDVRLMFEDLYAKLAAFDGRGAR